MRLISLVSVDVDIASEDAVAWPEIDGEVVNDPGSTVEDSTVMLEVCVSLAIVEDSICGLDVWEVEI